MRVVVVEGVGMLRQEQALEMAEAAQLVGKQVGFCTAPRFLFAAAVEAVYTELKQVSVTVDVVEVTVAVSVCWESVASRSAQCGRLTSVTVSGT